MMGGVFYLFFFVCILSYTVDGWCFGDSSCVCPSCCAKMDAKKQCIECKSNYANPPKCNKCARGYYFDIENGDLGKCRFCETSQFSYDEQYNCYQCSYGFDRPGFAHYGSDCVPCDRSCDYCSFDVAKTNNCRSCAAGYYNYSKQTSGLTCRWCSSSNCAKESCEKGFYYESASRSCLPCVTGCTACTAVDFCTECSSRYYAKNSQDGNLTCVACKSSGCVNETCEKGFYYDSANRTCVECSIHGCADCIASDSCTGCATGYYVKTSQNGIVTCVECDNDNCADQSCEEGYYYDNDNLKCIIVCQDGCAVCETPDSCSECAPGYYKGVNNSGCELCEASNCEECDGDGSCRTCSNMYFKDEAGVCACTVDHCTTCSQRNNCDDCIKGYYKDIKSGDCTLCEALHCLECNGDGSCKSCDNGYYKDSRSGSCTLCEALHCLECNEDGSCKSCDNGYYKDSRSGNCTLCEALHCLECNEDGSCKSCSAGYYNNELGVCACTVEHCTTCSKEDKCDACVEGYEKDITGICLLFNDPSESVISGVIMPIPLYSLIFVILIIQFVKQI